MNLRASSTSWLFGGKEPVAIQSALSGRAQLGQHQPGHRQWPSLTTSLEQGISLCVSEHKGPLLGPVGNKWLQSIPPVSIPGKSPLQHIQEQGAACC